MGLIFLEIFIFSSERILKLSVEDFMDLIQNSLAADFGFSDDAVMESLSDCLRRLQVHPFTRNLDENLMK